MKWVYLDPYWETLKGMQEKILKNEFDYNNYLWGQSFSARAQSSPN